ncbi:MAG: hypothetical protein IPM46_04070 [Flavobacteriales bacterium]|nr:hypothetical protein [Flavobacteriales bacterium]
MRCILVIDGVEQLEQADQVRPLAWLPDQFITGPLRVILTARPGDVLDRIKSRNWPALPVAPLNTDERSALVTAYLANCGKSIDQRRLERIANDPGTADPQYLKILLEELRVTGIHDQLDKRLDDYLRARTVTEFWKEVLLRYQREYEHDRPGLVGDALGLIYSARRGLVENELLEVLRSESCPLRPWAPLRCHGRGAQRSWRGTQLLQ